ncbi:MAG: aspartate aminotransferase family protein [Chloroflexi bacterium]|nr:aspartate aminotransferase family protein [Chloroflexota bacterium]
MTTTPQIPAIDDQEALNRAALENLYIGMTNHAQLAEEGGPLILTGSDGIRVTDINGREYIDGISGMYFRNVGHGREEIARAVYEQLSSVSMNVYASATPKIIQLAAKLAAITPGNLSRTFFSQGGSDANETALKMAQAFHVRRGDRGRFKVISRRGSYHGATYGTMWLGGHPGFPRTDYQPVPANVVHVPQPNPYRCELGGETAEECAELCAQSIEDAILFQGPDSVSAVIGEPVSQPLGGVVPHESYWPKVREICDKYGVLLIFDEVITGFGRLGTWFGGHYVGVAPDIMTFAKGVTSGYFPLGGAISTPEVADMFAGGPEKTFSHMYTYSAHPAGGAAGMAAIEIMERENLVENCRARGEQLSELLADMKDRHPIVGDARGVGLIQGLELVKDRDTKEHFDPSVKVNARLTEKLTARGIWIRVPAFIMPLAPPLIITADEILEMTTAVDEALTEVEAELGVA